MVCENKDQAHKTALGLFLFNGMIAIIPRQLATPMNHLCSSLSQKRRQLEEHEVSNIPELFLKMAKNKSYHYLKQYSANVSSPILWK